MNRRAQSYDVLVIGGGPAGMAAAVTAQESGARVAIVDDNPGLGGQIWRGEQHKSSTPEASRWIARIRAANIEFISGARVFDQTAQGRLLVETNSECLELGYEKLILATGARERFLPFPGWTLPGVAGAGGLQALVKSGLPMVGKRVGIAGTGPLLLAVAAYLHKQGAKVLFIAEQASISNLLSFGLGLWRTPGKIWQAMQLQTQLLGIPFWTSCWPIAAQGEGQLQRVTLQQNGRRREAACDYLACGFHLVPNTELAAFFGCALHDDVVQVNEFQETSVAGIYCAGESTGIGGLDVSLIEGQIAGAAATGQREKALTLFPARHKQQRFATLLNQAFALRDELKTLPQADTIVCRCEDVRFAQLEKYAAWRAAKLQTRCGMGPCQGRICGAAIDFLLGWRPDSIRPPVFPVQVGSLIQPESTAVIGQS